MSKTSRATRSFPGKHRTFANIRPLRPIETGDTHSLPGKHREQTVTRSHRSTGDTRSFPGKHRDSIPIIKDPGKHRSRSTRSLNEYTGDTHSFPGKHRAGMVAPETPQLETPAHSQVNTGVPYFASWSTELETPAHSQVNTGLWGNLLMEASLETPARSQVNTGTVRMAIDAQGKHRGVVSRRKPHTPR